MVTYKQAGVDIDAGDAAVEDIARHVKSTYTPQVLSKSHGGFAGMFLLDHPPGLLRRNFRNPVLVACTDGVGTKLDVAFRMGVADTVGIDLVAMCVNDLIVQGAEPLFFLDYIAVGKMLPRLVGDIVKGIAKGCREAGCAILGGETAEMPGFYADGHYELAGFSVGVAERTRLITGSLVRPGDHVIGLLSSGLHSNGYSLVRRIFFGDGATKRRNKRALLERTLSGCASSLGEELLRPTRIYVRPILQVLRRYRHKRVVHAMAHITGGGLPGNVPRVLPSGVDVVIQRQAWQPPAIFEHIRRAGRVRQDEMFRVFNMGIGMVLIVSCHFSRSILEQLARMKVGAVRLGEVVEGAGRLRLE